MSAADRDLAIDIDLDDMVTADEVFDRRPGPTPWPSSHALLALVIAVLPTIADDIEADLIEHLALAIVNRDEKLVAVRDVLAAALGELHVAIGERGRMRDQDPRVVDEYRRLRVQTLRDSEAA